MRMTSTGRRRFEPFRATFSRIATWFRFFQPLFAVPGGLLAVLAFRDLLSGLCARPLGWFSDRLTVFL